MSQNRMPFLRFLKQALKKSLTQIKGTFRTLSSIYDRTFFTKTANDIFVKEMCNPYKTRSLNFATKIVILKY